VAGPVANAADVTAAHPAGGPGKASPSLGASLLASLVHSSTSLADASFSNSATTSPDALSDKSTPRNVVPAPDVAAPIATVIPGKSSPGLETATQLRRGASLSLAPTPSCRLSHHFTARGSQ